MGQPSRGSVAVVTFVMSRVPRPRVAKLNDQPILEAHQIPEVDDQPRRPGEKSAEPDAFDVGDSGGSADGRQVSLVAVVEGAVPAPLQPRPDDAGGVAPLLHGDGRDTLQGDRRAGSVTDAHHVPDGEHFGVPGKRQIALDGDAAVAVALGSGQLCQPAGEAGRGDAGGPDDHAAGDALRAAVSALQRDAGGVDSDHPPPGENRGAEAPQ